MWKVRVSQMASAWRTSVSAARRGRLVCCLRSKLRLRHIPPFHDGRSSDDAAPVDRSRGGDRLYGSAHGDGYFRVALLRSEERR